MQLYELWITEGTVWLCAAKDVDLNASAERGKKVARLLPAIKKMEIRQGENKLMYGKLPVEPNWSDFSELGY